MDLRTGDVRVLRQPVLPERGGGDLAPLVQPDVLEERGPQRLGDAALDLAPALHGVHDLARVRRVHTAQDPDLTGSRIDGEPEPLGVEGDGTRRPAEVAVRREFPAGRLRRGVQLLQQDAGVAVLDRVLQEAALVAVPPEVLGREGEEGLRQGLGGAERRLASTTTVPVDPKAPVSCFTTSVSDWRTVIRSTVVPSSPAAICRWTVVVPLPNSAVPTARSRVPSASRLIRASAMCPPGGPVAIMDSADPSPTSHPSGAAPALPARASRTMPRHWSSP